MEEELAYYRLFLILLEEEVVAVALEVALEEEGFIEGKNVKFDRQNAQGEQPNCAIIARKFEDDRVDLIHAISTPNAQASVKISKTIPIVFSSVTDPVATGIVPKMGKTGTHVTGVSDMWPIELQCRVYQDMIPHAKRWGTIYNPGDVNVTFHIKEMKMAMPPVRRMRRTGEETEPEPPPAADSAPMAMPPVPLA